MVFKKTFMFVGILVGVLLILTIGEKISVGLIQWLGSVLGVTINTLSDFVNVVSDYILSNPIKSVIALIISAIFTIDHFAVMRRRKKSESTTS